MTPSRPPVEIHKRKPLKRVEIGKLIVRQDCKCGCGCGERLTPEAMIDEHIKPLAEGGTNELENRAFYNIKCAKLKTNCDIVRIRRAERMAGRTGQYARRKRNGSKLKSNAKIQSRGFPSKAERAAAKKWKEEKGI